MTTTTTAGVDPCPLGPIADLPASELERWLGRALQGRERLPLVVPDEHPHLAIARCEGELDATTRRDLRQALTRLVVAFTASGDNADPDYVVALTGLVRELEVENACAALGRYVTRDGFEARPLAVRSRILSTLIDMRFPISEKFWREQVQLGRYQPLALQGLLSAGLVGLDVLVDLRGDQSVGDAVYMVLSDHGRRLDTADRERMVRRVAELESQCSGAILAAVQEWLGEHAEPGFSPRASTVVIDSRAECANAFLEKFHTGNGGWSLEPCAAGLVA